MLLHYERRVEPETVRELLVVRRRQRHTTRSFRCHSMAPCLGQVYITAVNTLHNVFSS